MQEEYIVEENGQDEEPEKEEESPSVTEDGEDAIDEKTEINQLLDEGYSIKQIIDLGFKRRTVYYHAKGRLKPEGAPKSSNGHTSPVNTLPAKLESKQVIVPEYLIKHLSFIDGDKKQVAVDMVLIWEAARRSVMEDVMILQGLTTAQAQTTETQLRILREAKSESREIAQAAAEQAAQIVGGQVSEAVQQAAKPNGPNPMVNMFTNAIQPYFAQALSKTFSMFGMVGGMGGQGGMPVSNGQPGQPAQGEQPSVINLGGKQISDKEMEEVFNDG